MALFDIEIFCNIISVFTVTFGKFITAPFWKK